MFLRRFWQASSRASLLSSPAEPRDPGRPAVVVMHVPKTSGTAVREGMAEALAPCRAVFGMDRHLFGTFDGFASMSRAVRATVFLDPAELPHGFDLVVGHMALSTLRAAYPEGQLVTVLREPQSRLLSHWVFWRGHTDAQLTVWGDWGDVVRRARDPLAVFLADPALACQTDNLMLRMLLLPNALIPPDGFIAPESDAQLLDAAMQRLAAFAFLDMVENPKLELALGSWLGAPLRYPRSNVAPAVPEAFRSPLHRELTDAALELLAERSRLDRRLWEAVARERLPQVGQETLQSQTLLRTVARHSLLLA